MSASGTATKAIYLQSLRDLRINLKRHSMQIKELRGETRERFCLNMLRWLSKPGRDDYRGGITDREIEFYKNYMQGEY